MANTIVLKGHGHHDEGVCGVAVTPGMAVERQPDGKYDPTTSSSAAALKRGLQIAKEDTLQGKIITNDYALDDILFFYSPQIGDHINVLVKSGEDIDIADKLVVEGSTSGLFIEATGSGLDEQQLLLTDFKVHDAMTTDLTGTANADDMGLITGTPGTDAPTLQGVDFGATTADEKGSIEIQLPNDYMAGTAVTLRVRAAMLTTVSDGAATVDVEAWEADEDGAVGADLCSTALQSMNSLTPADLDFVITPTGLIAGDKLIVRLSFAASDTGNAGVMIQEISKVSLLTNIGLEAKLEALEDSGGALAANTHLACRVIA